MATTVQYYQQVLSAFPDSESLTILVASGVTRDAVLAALGADVSNPAKDAWDTTVRSTAWAAIEVPGGVLAVEMTGYGDPSLGTLATLSKDGSAAVVRSNIQAHHRFGCARAGEVVFDDDEFIYVDPASVPTELRELFDPARVDLDGEDDEVGEDPLPTGLAMAELVTGVELTEDLVAAVLEAEFFLAPSLRYPDGDPEESEAPVQVKLDRSVRKLSTIDVWTRDGFYTLISRDDEYRLYETRPPAPEGFGLSIGERTAWVWTITHRTMLMVSLMALSARAEPTALLEKFRSAFTREASGVVFSGKGSPEDGLRAVGEYNHAFPYLMVDGEGRFNLHVFARATDMGGEEHVLVSWPATTG